jgi:cell division topological specificity factor
MARLIDRMLGRGSKPTSANTAKERLQFILVHDRINLPPEQLQAMKEEILAVISKYVSVDSERVDIALQQRDRNDNLLVAEIPFSKAQQGSGKAAESEKEDKTDSGKGKPKDARALQPDD